MRQHVEPEPARGSERYHFTTLNPRLLTPDRVLDIAYCVFVKSINLSEHPEDLEVRRFADRVVDDFNQMCADAEKGSKDWEYLFSVQQIIVSLSRGIIRRKRTYEQQLRITEDKKEQHIKRLTTETNQSGVMKAGLRGLLLGGLGYSMIHFLYPSLQLDGKREVNFASLATGIAFILVGTFIRSIVLARKITAIFNDYDHGQLQANILYQRSALFEYNRAEQAAGLAYESFSGERPMNLPGFEQVMAEELRRNQDREDAYMENILGPIDKCVRMVRTYRKRRAELAQAEPIRRE